MSKDTVRVRFEPQGSVIEVPAGSLVREAAAEAGINIDYPCGGAGTCGKCRVRVIDHPGDPTNSESLLLSEDELKLGLRLACRCRVQQDCTIEVPQTSLVATSFKILDSEEEGLPPLEISPYVSKVYVELPEPALEDDLPDLDRLCRELGVLQADVTVLRQLSTNLRKGDWKGTATLCDGRLLSFESGDTTNRLFGLAFDVGTTTLVGRLIDLTTGQRLAAASCMNPQTSFGDDVLSRILYARESEANLAEIHRVIIDALNDLIRRMALEAGIAPGEICQATFAGNPTMQHLLAGINPGPLGEVPFIAAQRRGLNATGRDLGLALCPNSQVYVFPVIAGFVGGDTVAGLLSTGIADSDKSILFIDIGTNGEMVLVHEGQLLAASCAAGPALEGATIHHGMRAATGAVEQFAIDGESISYEVIGDVKPAGFCGSAFIDIVAELLRAGVLAMDGLFISPSEAGTLPEGLRARLRDGSHGVEFVLVDAAETAMGHDLVITQDDIRELQLAAGAIRSGASILLKMAGLTPTELDSLLVAGAFGNYLRVRNAKRVGLLVAEAPDERIQFAGNTSLAGARMASLSRAALEGAEQLSRNVRHVELSRDPGFQEEFMMAMFFPEMAG